jgi:ankyrin repeat protein
MSEQLWNAVMAGNAARVTSLLQDGADGNARDASGATLLMTAAGSGNLEVVNALLAAGVDVNAVDERGWGALTKAVYNAELDRGFPDVAQALIEAGANIEATIAYGVRPLMLAAGYGEAEVVQVLLDAGADFRAQNEGGRTALMMVKDKHYIDVINLLHEIEQAAGEGQSCGSTTAAGAKVVTFHKPGSRH